jgi:hypothetical protein
MSEPLKPGALCMVVRDVMNPSWAPCHGVMVGTPVTLADPDAVLSHFFKARLWRVRGSARCPICRGPADVYAEEELQPLRGPGLVEDVPAVEDLGVAA